MIRWIWRSLTVKMLAAFAIAVLVGIGGVAILANQSTKAEFESYVSVGQSSAAMRLASIAANAYRQTGSWESVSQIFARVPSGPGGRVVVADPAGTIVVDTSHQWLGQSASSVKLAGGVPVSASGQTFGTLYLVASRASEPRSAPPRGPFGDRFFGPGSSESQLSQAESTFLARVNQSILQVAIGATVVALIIGGLLARQIIRPLRDLTRAAQRIAQGHFAERIHVGGDDEVGQLARAFNHMAESLERTEEARRQLVADVAHELRTPLTVIGGTVQAIQDGVMPVDAQNLATIQEEVAALTSLVADLRDLSLADVGQFPLRRGPVDLVRILEQVAAAFATEAATRGVSLVVDVPGPLPAIDGDEARLRQCFRNLVDNALRHTSAGGRITLRGMARVGSLEVQVTDTGDGIAPEHLPHIFERFYRVDQSRARRSGGSGLGLAIVQQIVRAHGGEASVTSEGEGRGATFTVRLPAATAVSHAPLVESTTRS